MLSKSYLSSPNENDQFSNINIFVVYNIPITIIVLGHFTMVKFQLDYYHVNIKKKYVNNVFNSDKESVSSL